MTEPTRQLVFNEDGSIDPEQLVGYPADFIERVTSPEFKRLAAESIRRQQAGHERTGRREMQSRQVRIIPTDHFKNGIARNIRKVHRPAGMSGRQWRMARKLARRVQKSIPEGGL